MPDRQPQSPISSPTSNVLGDFSTMENSMLSPLNHGDEPSSIPPTAAINGLESAPQVAPTSPTGGAFIKGFDLESLRLKQDFAHTFGVKRQLTTVPIRKPRKDQFFRVHPDEAWRSPADGIGSEGEG